MALRDTTWFHDTTLGLGTPIVANANVRHYEKKTADTLMLLDHTQLTRTRTMITREWMAMSEAAMSAAIDCMQATTNRDTNISYKPVQSNAVLKSWKIMQYTDSKGAWT